MDKYLKLIKDKVDGNPLLKKILDHPDVYVAGGFLRDTILGVKHKDIDLFFMSPFGYSHAVETLGVSMAKRNVHNVYRKGNDYQLVKIEYYKGINDLIDSFDFNCVRLAYNNHEHAISPEAIDDIENYKVSVHKITKQVSSALRILRYEIDDWDIEETTKHLFAPLSYKSFTIDLDEYEVIQFLGSRIFNTYCFLRYTDDTMPWHKIPQTSVDDPF